MIRKKGMKVSRKFIKYETKADKGNMTAGIFTDFKILPLSTMLFIICTDEEVKKFQKISPDSTY
jgi:hypothetical protein